MPRRAKGSFMPDAFDLLAPASTTRPAEIGDTAPPGFFRFSEAGMLDPGAICDLLSGRRAGAMFRGIIAAPVRQRIAANFWNGDFRRLRGDDAPGWFAGSFHFKKRLPDYLDEAAASERELPQLFAGTEDIFATTIDAIATALAARGLALRQAEHQGRKASRFLCRALDPALGCPLAAHEDVAQLDDPRQHGFEVQRAARRNVVAVNFCLENGVDGGALSYWNLRPSPEGRRRLGLLGTGLPYPDALMAEVDRIELAIRPGDVYCFNGGYVHGVGAHPGARRSTLSLFMGQIDERTIVYWS
jgi:hypothetical protein